MSSPCIEMFPMYVRVHKLICKINLKREANITNREDEKTP